jgi:hypothetical protein
MADKEIERTADLYIAINKNNPQELSFEEFYTKMMNRGRDKIRDWATTDRMFAPKYKNIIKLF